MRAHVRTKSIIEYSNSDFFESRLYDIIASIIKYYCPDAILEDENGYWRDDWEIDVDDFKNMLDKIHEIGVSDFLPEDCSVKSNEIEKELKSIYEQATKKDNQFSYPSYIYIDWF